MDFDLGMKKGRVDYIDLMKGLTILWIIWIHSDHPDFDYYRTPVFFFISGIFFKLSDIKSFFVKRWRTIVVPFLFFYLLCVPLSCLYEIWEYRTWDISFLSRVTDLFYIESGIEGFKVNPPLWFLMALLWMHLFAFAIFRLPKWAILSIACLSIFFQQTFNTGFPTPLAINNALMWFGYFAIGYLSGKSLIGYLSSTKRKISVFSATLLTVIAFMVYDYLDLPDWHRLAWNAKLLAFMACYMSFFSFFDGRRELELLRFFGQNSMIVLGGHYWIVRPITHLFNTWTGTANIWLGLLASVITAILLIPVIRLMNSRIPYLIGKPSNSMLYSQDESTVGS